MVLSHSREGQDGHNPILDTYLALDKLDSFYRFKAYLTISARFGMLIKDRSKKKKILITHDFLFVNSDNGGMRDDGTAGAKGGRWTGGVHELRARGHVRECTRRMLGYLVVAPLYYIKRVIAKPVTNLIRCGRAGSVVTGRTMPALLPDDACIAASRSSSLTSSLRSSLLPAQAPRTVEPFIIVHTESPRFATWSSRSREVCSLAVRRPRRPKTNGFRFSASPASASEADLSNHVEVLASVGEAEDKWYLNPAVRSSLVPFNSLTAAGDSPSRLKHFPRSSPFLRLSSDLFFTQLSYIMTPLGFLFMFAAVIYAGVYGSALPVGSDMDQVRIIPCF